MGRRLEGLYEFGGVDTVPAQDADDVVLVGARQPRDVPHPVGTHAEALTQAVAEQRLTLGFGEPQGGIVVEDAPFELDERW